MYGMFYGASSFNSNISKWDVSSVTDMYGMFYGAASFNSDISRWDVSSVTNMYIMFNGAASFNSDVSNWNLGHVTDMYYMYDMFGYASSFNQNLCPWGPKLPSTFNYGNAYSMFSRSGCLNKSSPSGRTGPWCAVTNCTA
jgi:surface protein